MSDLERLLREIPREATPERELWQGIQGRIRPSRGWSGRWRLAAAAGLFLAGSVAGVAAERASASKPQWPRPAESPLLAAAAVQEAGSAYLAALHRLPRSAAGDAVARSQGYEAALVVMTMAAREMEGAPELEPAVSSLALDAQEARRAAAEQVRRLRGGSPR